MASHAAPGSGGIFALPCEDFGNVAVAENHVLATYFSSMPHVIRSHGADPDEVIGRFDIDPGAFREPESQICCARAMPLFEECSYMLDSPFLGLELAERQSANAYGYAAALCRAAPDLRAALDAFAAYVPLTVSPEGMFEVLESSNALELRWDCDSDLRQQLQGNLHGAAIMLHLLGDIIGDRFRPICVNLPQIPSGRLKGELVERLGCEVRSPSRHYGSIVISKAFAGRPLAHSNKFAFRALERPLAEIRQRIDGDAATRVKAFVRSRIGMQDCTVEECAATFGTSVRTLQKQLARMNVSFSSLLESEKCEMAKTALLYSTVSLDELAFKLGYAEQSTFGRAFRRWTDVTPAEFRRSSRRP
jgi:AraC-like DNA-binding protein